MAAPRIGLLVATADAEGRCDVSPKGDPAGFVKVLDARTLVMPERPGNRRADGFHNILANPHVGLIFLIPGRTETLRVNGRARLVSDAPWFDALVVEGHRPKLAVLIAIEQLSFHCSKAFLRSHAWESGTWTPDAVPSRPEIVLATEPSLKRRMLAVILRDRQNLRHSWAQILRTRSALDTEMVATRDHLWALDRRDGIGAQALMRLWVPLLQSGVTRPYAQRLQPGFPFLQAHGR